jgi:trans-aconitate methyltransferase
MWTVNVELSIECALIAPDHKGKLSLLTPAKTQAKNARQLKAENRQFEKKASLYILYKLACLSLVSKHKEQFANRSS